MCFGLVFSVCLSHPWLWLFKLLLRICEFGLCTVPLAKSYIDQVHIVIKDEIDRSVPFVDGNTLVKLHSKHIKKLVCFATCISINMMLTIDTQCCSSNTTRRRMDLSAKTDKYKLQ